MDVINMVRKIGFIAQPVLPITMLPDRLLALGNAGRNGRMAVGRVSAA